MIDQEMADKTWAMGDLFSMAAGAAAPALGYCRMVYPFTKHKNVVAYMNRLAERPSFQRVLKEAAPYLAVFKKLVRGAWLMIRYDVAVIGGGAAGLIGTIPAGKRGRRVLGIETVDPVSQRQLV